MTPSSRYLYALSFAIAAMGYLLPFWPLAVVGVLIATLSGRYVFGVVMALMLDVAWGVPTGILHYLYFPFTLLAFAAILARIFGRRYFFNRNSQETL